MDVPSLSMSDTLARELRRVAFSRRMSFGYDEIIKKLGNEKRGLEASAGRGEIAASKRISRLVLFSRNGSERFYRRVERLLAANTPRVLGCMLDRDDDFLGHILTGRNRRIKIMMVGHKDSVSAILRALVASSNTASADFLRISGNSEIL